MAHDQVNLTDIRKDISSPSLQRRLPTKKWSASNRVFIMGFGGLVVLGIVVAVSYAFKNQKTYNQSKELFQSLEAAKALRIIVKLEENYAVIEDEDEYIVQVAGHKVEKDAFGMNMVATMSTNGTKYVYRIYNQQVVYEEYNISSGNMTVSNCVAKDNLPPVAEFAQSILDGEVMDNEKYENFDCDNGKAVQVEWSNQALMYCMVKDKNGEVRIRTVVAQHISATVKYVDDEDVANMIKAAVNKPFVDENGTEKSCSVLYDTKSLSQTRRALQNAKPNENNGAHNIDFFYNSELEWTYGQALSTLTLNQYFDPHLNHGGNRFAYGYRNYDNHAYNADRHENFLYSTVDLINLMHGAGVRRLSYRAKNKMVCVFVHGANVVPRREGLQGRSNSRYWGKIKNKNCDSVKYLELNTWDYAWNDPELQTKTCEYLISAISKRKCGTVLSEMLIITHGSGALQVASALSSGKCSLGRTSKILPIQPPMDGSIYYGISITFLYYSLMPFYSQGVLQMHRIRSKHERQKIKKIQNLRANLLQRR